MLHCCVNLATAMRSAGGLVVFVRAERPGGTIQPPGSELAAECQSEPGDIVIVKRTLGAFHGTGLDNLLRYRGIDTVPSAVW